MLRAVAIPLSIVAVAAAQTASAQIPTAPVDAIYPLASPTVDGEVTIAPLDGGSGAPFFSFWLTDNAGVIELFGERVNGPGKFIVSSNLVQVPRHIYADEKFVVYSLDGLARSEIMLAKAVGTTSDEFTYTPERRLTNLTPAEEAYPVINYLSVAWQTRDWVGATPLDWDVSYYDLSRGVTGRLHLPGEQTHPTISEAGRMAFEDDDGITVVDTTSAALPVLFALTPNNSWKRYRSPSADGDFLAYVAENVDGSSRIEIRASNGFPMPVAAPCRNSYQPRLAARTTGPLVAFWGRGCTDGTATFDGIFVTNGWVVFEVARFSGARRPDPDGHPWHDIARDHIIFSPDGEYVEVWDLSL